jgi:predicted DNA-binding transcriptional regulator AlpA
LDRRRKRRTAKTTPTTSLFYFVGQEVPKAQPALSGVITMTVILGRDGPMPTVVLERDGPTPQIVQSLDAWLPARKVWERFDVCDMTLWRWLNDPDLDFPRPIVINHRRFFKLSEIETWERQQAKKAGKAGKVA